MAINSEQNAGYHLYGAPYCHLCDDARVVLESMPALELELVDISTSFALKKAYGLRIPVLKNIRTQAELNWPFDKKAVLEFARV